MIATITTLWIKSNRCTHTHTRANKYMLIYWAQLFFITMNKNRTCYCCDSLLSYFPSFHVGVWILCRYTVYGCACKVVDLHIFVLVLCATRGFLSVQMWINIFYMYFFSSHHDVACAFLCHLKKEIPGLHLANNCYEHRGGTNERTNDWGKMRGKKRGKNCLKIEQ